MIRSSRNIRSCGNDSGRGPSVGQPAESSGSDSRSCSSRNRPRGGCPRRPSSRSASSSESPSSSASSSAVSSCSESPIIRMISAARLSTVGQVNRLCSGRSTAKLAAHLRHDLCGQQRMAAEREEVVVDADPLDSRAPAPRSRRRPPRSGSAARHSRRRSGPARVAGSGSACRSTLPLGVRGSASSRTITDGTMNSGSQAARWPRSSSGRPGQWWRVGDQAHVAPAPGWATTTASLTAGCERSAASTSAGSTR